MKISENFQFSFQLNPLAGNEAIREEMIPDKFK